MKLWFIIAAILIGLFRPVLLFREFNPHIESGYEAIAHIFVGILLGIWLIDRKYNGLISPWKSWAVPIFWTLNAIEVTCAAIAIAMKKGLL
jgi:hypothetical protein